jgi:hypothetical protein
MSRRLILLFIAVIILPYGLAFAEISKDGLTVSGYLKNELSVGLDTFNEVTKFKNIFQLSGEYGLS